MQLSLGQKRQRNSPLQGGAQQQRQRSQSWMQQQQQRQQRPYFQSPARWRVFVAVLLLLLASLLLLAPLVTAYDHDYEYVRQVLEDDDLHRDDDDNIYHRDDDDFQRTQQQQQAAQEEERLRQEQLKRLQQEKEEQEQKAAAEKLQREREQAFERELAKMNEQQRKQARKQKRKDAAMVQRILRAAQRDDLYGVLRLRNKELVLPERTIRVAGKVLLRIPEMRLFRMETKDIRKAYRAVALAVHPDKNRDGRAQEAFVAVENAASILSDETLRDEYDQRVRLTRREERERLRQYALQAVDSSVRNCSRTLTVVRKVLGPFSFPVLVLGTLLI